MLHIGNGESVARRFFAIDVDVDVKALRDAFGEDGSNLRKARKDLLYLRASLLDAFESRTLYFHPERSFDSGQFHVQAVFNRHSPGVGESRKLQFGVHLLNEFFVSHPCAPLFAWFEHDGRVVHVERGVVRGAVRASDGSEYGFNFRERVDDAVLRLKELRSLTNGNSRQCGRHVQGRAFKQRRHELTPDLERQRKRDDQKNQVEQQCRFAKP